MAHDVFISYSHEDKTTADAVCATLEANGIRCWIAPRDVLPGSDWGESIIDAITDACAMVLVFSSNSNKAVHVKSEVERAVNKGIAIIPFRIEDVLPSKSLEYFISTHHWLDALTPPLEKHLQHLAATMKVLLSREGQGNSTPIKEPRLKPDPSAISISSTQDIGKRASEPLIESPTGGRAEDRSKRKLYRTIFWVLMLCLVVGALVAGAIKWPFSKPITKPETKGESLKKQASDYFIKAIESKSLDQAIFLYSKAIKINPDLEKAYYNRAFLYLEKGLYDLAISDHNQAIKLNPNHALNYNDRGYAYFRKGLYNRALSDYNQAIKIDPGFGMIYNNRAVIYYYLKEYEKAWADVRQAQALDYSVKPSFVQDLKNASGREK